MTELSRVSVFPYVLCAVVLVLVLCSVLAICWDELVMGQGSVVANCAILTLLSFLCLVIIWRQPQTRDVYSFKVGLHLLILFLFGSNINIYVTLNN